MAFAEVAGTIRNVTGVVHVHAVTGQFMLAYDGADFNGGDTLVTENLSSALLVFTDGTQTAVRPNSRYQVTNYHFDKAQPQADSLFATLFKGGFRMVSGFISKRGNRDALEVRTVTSTIGIRGTDFSARLCEADCVLEQGKTAKTTISALAQAGRVASSTGRLIATNNMGHTRALVAGSPIFEGETLQASGECMAVIVTTDGTRFVMESSSRLLIQQYKFNPREPENNNALFRMLAGTLRVVTGVIAKVQPHRVTFHTATATIGIRGTAFDMVCRNEKGQMDDQGNALPSNECGGGLYVSMRDGTTEVRPGDKSMIATKGQTVFVDGPRGNPVLLQTTPDFIQTDTNQVPENLEIDLDVLFGRSSQPIPPGLYVEVMDGRVALKQDGHEVLIDKGETGFSAGGGGQPVKLNFTPTFLDADPFVASFTFIRPAICTAR
jgi:hypothetical protein